MDLNKVHELCWKAMSTITELKRGESELNKIAKLVPKGAPAETLAIAEAEYNNKLASMNTSLTSLRETAAELNKELNG